MAHNGVTLHYYFSQGFAILRSRSALFIQPMIRTVHLGYKCGTCRTRVPVYTFTRSNGKGAQTCTPPVDRVVQCPGCHTSRHVAFAEIQSLERWEVKGGADHLAA
jgi:hypothetical protein